MHDDGAPLRVRLLPAPAAAPLPAPDASGVQEEVEHVIASLS